MTARPFLFHYHCDEIDDRGWGCVFRSMQNATYLIAARPVSMRSMVDRFGPSWIEPAELVPFVPRSMMSQTWLYTKTSTAHYLMARTFPHQYEFHTHKVADLLSLPLNEFYLVVDNGVFAYCLYHHDHEYWLIDPHTTDPRLARRSLSDAVEFLSRSDCWMVLAIKKRLVSGDPDLG